MPDKINVAVVVSGNFGPAMTKMSAEYRARCLRVANFVPMYVGEGEIDDRKLTELAYTPHGNVRHVAGAAALPPQSIAIPDLIETCKNADVLVVVTPHQFVHGNCKVILGKIEPSVIGLSLIKGFEKNKDDGINLLTHIITRHVKIPCSVLMGANIAREQLAEIKAGCQNAKKGEILSELFENDNFRVCVVDDVNAVEVCGTLENIVTANPSFVDGLGLGDNTEAALMRLGLMEMINFVGNFYPGNKIKFFFESCGVTDLMTTSYGGSTAKVAAAFAKKPGEMIEQLETQMLNCKKFESPPTAEEVSCMLKREGLEDKFPLFTAIHKICTNQARVQDMITFIHHHPKHAYLEETSDGEKPSRTVAKGGSEPDYISSGSSLTPLFQGRPGVALSESKARKFGSEAKSRKKTNTHLLYAFNFLIYQN